MRDLVFDTAKRFLRYTRVSGPRNIGGPCPFHKGGEEKKPSFYINIENGLYYCHSCHVSGTLPQFLKAMGESAAVIDSALSMAREQQKEYKQKVHKEVARGEHLINEALLGVFNYCPTSLVDVGFDEEVLKELDIGFDTHLMRVTYPIRDLYGLLVGISGRAIDDDDFPRYKVYKSKDFLEYAPDDPITRARYERYDIKNHNFLWNMHNVYPRVFFGDQDEVIIVEGYKACIWMIQHGFPNTIALQGSRMTQAQETLLSRLSGPFIIFLDNDKAGKEGSFNTGRRLSRHSRQVNVCSYPDWLEAGAPDDLNQEEIQTVLNTAKHFHFWRQLPWNTHLNGRNALRDRW